MFVDEQRKLNICDFCIVNHLKILIITEVRGSVFRKVTGAMPGEDRKDEIHEALECTRHPEGCRLR